MEMMPSNPSPFADENRKDGEWSGVESAERCCSHTSNCECWVVSRRSADLLRRRGGHRRLSFVQDGNTLTKVQLLGTFSSSSVVPWNFEEKDTPEWYEDLVIPSLSIPFFSLTKFLRHPAKFDENGHLVAPAVYGDVGISFSLPVHPPPSQMIPSQEHALPADVDVIRGEMIGSCNGLYCLRSRPALTEVSVILWNPTIEKSRQLPPFLFRHSERRRWEDCLFGFGYDQSSDDYKVVKIDADPLLVEVFSLNSNSWRTVHGFAPRCLNFQRYFCIGAVSVAGCLNWLVSLGPTVVVSFDLATEKFRILASPPPYGNGESPLNRSSLCVLGGCLSFVTLHDLSPDCGLSWCRSHSRVLDIWVMTEYGVESSWTNAATITFPHSVGFPYRILHLSEDVLILAVHFCRLFVFNLKENSLVCLHIRGGTTRYRGVEPYVQSEVSPYGRCKVTFVDGTLEISPACPPREESDGEGEESDGDGEEDDLIMELF